MKKLQIAIDGPASAGKSTIAKILAKDLNMIYCDTGAMYRALTYLALTHHVDVSNSKALLMLLKQYPISFKASKDNQRVFVGREEVTQAIRENNINEHVSDVASLKAIRKKMVELQQQFASDHSIVMDGRDIASKVLPKADVKIFLVASVEERAFRRYKENKEKGIVSDLKEIQKSIEKRDYLDTHRSVSPLTKVKEAVEIDTTGKTIDQVVLEIKEIMRKQTN